MQHHRPAKRPHLRLTALVFGLLVAGCSVSPPAPEPPPPAPIRPEATPEPPVVAPAQTEPTLQPEPAPVVRPAPPPPPPPPVALFVSSDIEAYAGVEQALIYRLGAEQARLFELHGSPDGKDELLVRFAQTGIDRIVAVGYLAATVAAEADARYKVFCQILNFEPHDLLAATSGGTKLLPPFKKQLIAWQSLSPELKSVGVITGPDQDALVAEIQKAAMEVGLRLETHTARTDKEALYELKRMTPRIDGFWLLPDNRILSPDVIREIMAYGAKHEKQVVVFNDKLLSLGALMSITSDPDDVAEQALVLLERAERGEGPVVVPLTRMQVRINRDAADRLGVVAPPLNPDLAAYP